MPTTHQYTCTKEDNLKCKCIQCQLDKAKQEIEILKDEKIRYCKAKLKPIDVYNIRVENIINKVPLKELRKRYPQVTRQNILMILQGLTWKNAGGPTRVPLVPGMIRDLLKEHNRLDFNQLIEKMNPNIHNNRVVLRRTLNKMLENGEIITEFQGSLFYKLNDKKAA